MSDRSLPTSAPHPALDDSLAEPEYAVDGPGVYGMPDTPEELEREVDAAAGPADQRPLLSNLIEATHGYWIPGADGTKTWHQHPAMFWVEEKTKKVTKTDADGESYTDSESVKVFTLVAPWVIEKIVRIRRWDTSLGECDEYEIHTRGVAGTHRITAAPEDLAEMRKARAVFAPAGGLGAGGNSARFGDALMQLRLYIEAPTWGETVRTTDGIGRLPAAAAAAAGTDSLFTFPGVTIGADGPTEAVRYDGSTYPNTADKHLRVSWSDDRAALAAHFSAWLDAAMLADPSAGHYVLGTMLGWGAASAWSSQIMEHPNTGGMPILYADGTPGSGKSTITPRLLSIFGQHPTRVSAGMSTYASVRDKFTATIDCPWTIDELNVEYVTKNVAEAFRETIKDAYNGRDKNVGGKFGSGNFRTRSVRTSPTVALLGERLPQMDPAIMDRILSVSMPRRDNLAPEVRDASEVGMRQLSMLASSERTPELAGAWYAHVLKVGDVAGLLERAEAIDLPSLEHVSNRNRPAVRIVVAGLYALSDFAAELGGPQLAGKVAKLIEAFTTVGVTQLTARMGTLKSVGGAVAMLRSLAMLTATTHPDRGGAMRGTHWQVDLDQRTNSYVLRINPRFVISLLRTHERALGHSVMDETAFRDEIAQWGFCTPQAKKQRPVGAGRACNPVTWYQIDLDQLEAFGGPGREDFDLEAEEVKFADYPTVF